MIAAFGEAGAIGEVFADIFGFGGGDDDEDTVNKNKKKSSLGPARGARAQQSLVLQSKIMSQTNNASVSMDFSGIPRGTKIQTDVDDGLDFDFNMGFAGAPN